MPIRAWWEGLAKREQLLVGVAAVLLPIALIVILGIRPLVARANQAAVAVTDKRSLLADVESVASRLGPQVASTSVGSDGQSLVLLVDKTTRTHNLTAFLKRNEPDGTNGIRLRFENVAFDDLVSWLAELQNTYKVDTVAASFDPAQETGRVSCSVQLTRGPAA
jgi:general secretion pathway protein M